MLTISAIMPTRGRREYAQRALESFLSQTYPAELVILDDAADLSFPSGVNYPQVQYHVSASRSIAEKRNECCRLAKGDVIVHFDSDDWSAPTRIADQVKLLEESGKAVLGFCTVLFYDQQTRRAYRWGNDDRISIAGTSLCYKRDWAIAHPFAFEPGFKWGEDNAFKDTAKIAKQLIVVPGGSLIVAGI